MNAVVVVALVVSLASTAIAEDITPHVGLVQVFGLHKLSAKKIESALGDAQGNVPPSQEQAEKRVAAVPGVLASNVEAVCCFHRNMILYVGVEEKGEPHVNFHALPQPAPDLNLPQEITDKYNALLDATAASLRGRNADEDLTNGYSLLADPEGREIQQSLSPLVAAHLSIVDQVVRTSGDPEQRAAAAYVLQYAPRTPREGKIMGDDLQYALQDPDPEVRRIAMQSLTAVLVGARLHPEQPLHIEATWFVELMNSTLWSDRRYASLALVTLTDKADAKVLALVRERALRSVIDMASWQDLEHALPGFLLAGRLAGLTDKETQAAWVRGDREAVLGRLAGDRSSRKHG